MQVLNAYKKKQSWVTQVKLLVEHLSIGEMHVLFHEIFISACVEGIKSGTCRNNLPKGKTYKTLADLHLTEQEALTEGLTKHYPRCELTDLHARIRSLVLMIQSQGRLHHKLTWVGELQQNEVNISVLAFRRR